MRIDKELHRTILLELIDKATFPGSARNIVVEIADAIERAEVDDASCSASDGSNSGGACGQSSSSAPHLGAAL